MTTSTRDPALSPLAEWAAERGSGDGLHSFPEASFVQEVDARLRVIALGRFAVDPGNSAASDRQRVASEGVDVAPAHWPWSQALVVACGFLCVALALAVVLDVPFQVHLIIAAIALPLLVRPAILRLPADAWGAFRRYWQRRRQQAAERRRARMDRWLDLQSRYLVAHYHAHRSLGGRARAVQTHAGPSIPVIAGDRNVEDESAAN